MPIKFSFDIVSLVMKWFTTTLTNLSLASKTFYPAFKRAMVVSMGNGFFYNKRFITPDTNFYNIVSSGFVIARSRTERTAFSPRSKRLSALLTRTRKYFAPTIGVTFMRAKSMLQFRLVIGSSMKRITALITNKFISNKPGLNITGMRTELSFSVSGFDLFTTLITGNNRHVSLDVVNTASKYTKKELKVYDITVENEHCFYANNILVHNCQRCLDMEKRSPFTIAEIEGLIPLHPQCRCLALPLLPDS